MARTALIKGISFPFRKGSASFPAKASDEQLIKEDLYQLLLTGVGSRVMRPDLGTNILSFIFENNDDLLGPLVQAEIQSAITRYETRVSLDDITIYRNDSEITIAIEYTIVATGNSDSLSVAVSKP